MKTLLMVFTAMALSACGFFAPSDRHVPKHNWELTSSTCGMPKTTLSTFDSDEFAYNKSMIFQVEQSSEVAGCLSQKHRGSIDFDSTNATSSNLHPWWLNRWCKPLDWEQTYTANITPTTLTLTSPSCVNVFTKGETTEDFP